MKVKVDENGITKWLIEEELGSVDDEGMPKFVRLASSFWTRNKLPAIDSFTISDIINAHSTRKAKPAI